MTTLSMTADKIMEHASIVGQYLGYITAGVLGLLMAWNRLRRDSSSTQLQEKADNAAGNFVDNLIIDHRRLVGQLKEAHDDRAANAEKVGGLTAEVNILRGQIGEVKELLELLSGKLDMANQFSHTLEKDLATMGGQVFRLTMERDSAVIRARNAEKEVSRLKAKYEP